VDLDSTDSHLREAVDAGGKLASLAGRPERRGGEEARAGRPLTPQWGFDITFGMATRWLPSTLDALHRKCSTDGAAGFSTIGRRETAWFLQEALLEEQTLVPPDAERIQKIKALIRLVDHAG
jgi:hypothetical protein